MKIIIKHITLKQEALTLTNQRAIYWERENALILSDLHIGKTAHFRKHGIPIPDDILQKDLLRLENLIHHFKPKKLLIVGDLFHAEANKDVETFKTWLHQFQDLKIILIKGNHDRLSKRLMDELNIEAETKLYIEPFTFVHEPLEDLSETFTISGHIHPGVLIKGKGKQKLKLPCYLLMEKQLILPAFSLFTGLNTQLQNESSISYAFTNDAFYEI